MAATDAPDRQPTALQGAVSNHGLPGIFRAGWGETALTAKVRRQGDLVQTDRPDQQSLQRVHGAPGDKPTHWESINNKLEPLVGVQFFQPLVFFLGLDG